MDSAPAYRVTVTLPDGRWYLRNLAALQSGLTTALAVGGLDMSFADPTGEMARVLGKEPPSNGLPVCLNAPVLIECKNVWGEWGKAWTGYITSAGPSFDTQQGHLYHITAGDGLKPFAVQTQSAGDVAALTLAGLSNVSASSVLRFAAQELGFPASRLSIDVQADAGSGVQTDVPPATFLSPQQSTWLAVLNGIAQFTGNILFADEVGTIHYRPIDYQAPPKRSIPASVVSQYHLANSDEEVATLVEVRYGYFPVANTAPRARESTGTWAQQLGERKLITYMPWLQAPGAAQWAATTLLRQGMAQMGVGQVTLLADHAYHVGDTVRLDFAGVDAFIQTVTQQWQWGSSWLMTLGLTHVRRSGQRLPTTVVPSNLQQAGFPDTSRTILTIPEQQAVSLAQTGRAQPLTLTLTATNSKTAIPAGSDLVGPASLFTTGSTAIVRDADTNGPPQLGSKLKALPTIAASGTVADGALLVYDPPHVGSTEQVVVQVTAIPAIPLDVGATYGNSQVAQQQAAQLALATLKNPPAGSPTTTNRYVAPPGANPWITKVLNAAIKMNGAGYQFTGMNVPDPSTPGADAFSCVALVAFAFRVSGFAAHLATKYPRDPYAADINATTPVYDQDVLYQLPGNTLVTSSAIQPGDILLFSGTSTDPHWGGSPQFNFSHAALAVGIVQKVPAVLYSGAHVALTTDTAMIGAENAAQGVTFDDYASAYWASHLAAVMRPDYAP